MYFTPFNLSSWFIRNFTGCELTHLWNLQVANTKHVRTAHPGDLPHRNALRSGITVKVLSYALLLTGYCSETGGVDIFLPKYTTIKGGILVSQDVFNTVAK